MLIIYIGHQCEVGWICANSNSIGTSTSRKQCMAQCMAKQWMHLIVCDCINNNSENQF